MLKVIAKVFGSKNERELKKLQPIVEEINGLEPQFKVLSDDELKAKTPEFKRRLAEGETLDELLPEAFAAIREASRRVLGMRHFDVQLIGGIILHRGAIAEMRTGEGKTLTATAPIYLHALSGKGAHVVTVNDYLAKRDAEWMGKVYGFMGLTTGVILHGLDDEQRRDQYHCDVTYGTNNELGFDYLRDNMKYTKSTLVQRGFNYAIVDEVDSVLIDEARTPLIISGPSDDSSEKYYQANEVVHKLTKDEDYTVDEKDQHALLTERGIQRAEKLLGVDNLYDPSNIKILHAVEQSLKAHHLFKKDVDYVVKDGQVIIIDQHTGRPMPGRRYSDGLHQALEAKEAVKIERQSQTLASITFQNFFRMYDTLSGMTGTAETEAPEFLKIYNLLVYVIPTNRPMVRDDTHDLIYRSKKEKFDAILSAIVEEHQQGRPVLVGTIAIETSEELSAFLSKKGIKHTVLNAKYHSRESEIVAQAGRKFAVTIATNMAGRGTDIILGGNPEMLALSACALKEDADFEAELAKHKEICAKEKEEVLDLGGLFILGTERHESRRIDNQLRGRAGRQGDPGRSTFFLSLEDNLLRLFGSPRMKQLMIKNMEEGVPIEHGLVTKAIERAQKQVEARNFEIRKHLLDYDDVMNIQRNTFYKMRWDILNGNPRNYLFERAHAILKYVLESFANTSPSEEGVHEKLGENLRTQFNFNPEEKLNLQTLMTHESELRTKIEAKYAEKWDALGIDPANITDHERFVILFVIDQQWKDHMRNMDYLKEGIGLQGYAQRDPLIEYKKESFRLFNDFMDRIDEEVVKILFHLQPTIQEESIQRMRVQRKRDEKAMRMASKEGESPKAKTVRRSQPKVGRNEPCPCGSGKKYKQCHGK